MPSLEAPELPRSFCLTAPPLYGGASGSGMAMRVAPIHDETAGDRHDSAAEIRNSLFMSPEQKCISFSTFRRSLRATITLLSGTRRKSRMFILLKPLKSTQRGASLVP